MVRREIRAITSQIQPLDEEEAKHIALAQEWIDSGAEIFRSAIPTMPDPHLVVYFLLIDRNEQKLLLVEHKKANLWLPTGGHVEKDEHPKETVFRECFEELGLQADFLLEKPFFLTVTKTRGDLDIHTDVSLWYLLKGSAKVPLQFEKEEFYRIQWFALSEIPFDKSDPHMWRLVQKLVLYKSWPFSV